MRLARSYGKNVGHPIWLGKLAEEPLKSERHGRQPIITADEYHRGYCSSKCAAAKSVSNTVLPIHFSLALSFPRENRNPS